MLFWLPRRFLMTSTKFFLLLTGASAFYVYLTSLKRGQEFSLTPIGVPPFWWLHDLYVDYRTLLAFILVGLLATLIRSTKFFLLLTGASAIFVYLVSPTRDPDFGKFSAPNGGSSLWWLQSVVENHWMLAAVILAALVAINLTLDLWQWCQPKTIFAAYWKGRIPRKIAQLRDFLLGIMQFWIGIWMWWLVSYVFLLYLLGQWLID
jgi:hypothetical protein